MLRVRAPQTPNSSLLPSTQRNMGDIYLLSEQMPSKCEQLAADIPRMNFFYNKTLLRLRVRRDL